MKLVVYYLESSSKCCTQEMPYTGNAVHFEAQISRWGFVTGFVFLTARVPKQDHRST